MQGGTGSRVRYAHSADGIDIAYLTLGDGPRSLVFVPGFVSHLDLLWDLPPLATLSRRLSEIGRVAVFDKRGTGVSDRSLGFGSLEERMDDIRAVMDAAGMERASLFGISEGGPLTLLFAATYPERVERVAIYGTFARGTWAPDYDFAATPEAVERLIDTVREQWGTGSALSFFVNHMPDAPDVRATVARYERSACTPATAAEILRLNVGIDIRSLLPSIAVPTLVMHTSGDPLLPVQHGRYLAEHIPDARYAEREGDFHVPWRPSDTWMVDEVAAFLGASEEPGPVARRTLASVLFTDIVRSTERVAEVGDAAWREVLDRHDTECARQVEAAGGRVVKGTGDGLLAAFDGPSKAIECARAICDAVGTLGLDVRAGVHTGEVEQRDGDLGGIGVHIAARVAAAAGPGEVWVSRTVKDLTAGSGLGFSERGPHRLKGVPDEWELYSLVA